MATMTLAVALAKAKRQVSFGYHQLSGTEVWTTCPDCRVRIHVEVLAWATPTQRCHALVNRLVEHLRANCDKEL